MSLNGSIGVVFPGQGSQSVGMLDAFAEEFSLIKETVEEASQVLGENIWELIHEGPAEKLNATEFTQVAMLVADVAIYRVLQSVVPFAAQMMAGHSLGEYSALVCGGALSFQDAVLLVKQRGKLMQQYIPLGIGAMAAIVGLSDEIVEQICVQASEKDSVVTPANYNAIGQVVVAGHEAAVQRVMLLAEQSGARLAKKIPVSVPCHCGLLYEAAEAFVDALQSVPFSQSSCPIISNVTARSYASTQDMRLLLQKQLYSPVQWVKTVQYMRQQGVTHMIECGPGQVLSGLIKRIDREISVNGVFDLASLQRVVQ